MHYSVCGHFADRNVRPFSQVISQNADRDVRPFSQVISQKVSLMKFQKVGKKSLISVFPKLVFKYLFFNIS